MSEPVLTTAEAEAGFTTGGAMHETDTSAVPQGLPADASESQVFKAFTQLPSQPDDPAPDPSPTPEPKPVEKVLDKPGPDADDIPEQFLTGKKEEAKPDEDAELKRILTERPKGYINKDNFTRLQEAANTKIEALSAQLAERDAKLAEAISKSGQPPEEITKQLQALQQERDEFSERLMRTAAQDHPEFQTKYVSREKAITERLNQRGKELGISEEVLDAALRSSFKRRTDLVEDLEISPTAKAALTQLMEQYDDVQQQKGAFLAQSREELSKWQQQQKQQADAMEKARAEHEDSTFNSALEDIRKSFAPFQRVEGNEAWNKQAETLENEAKKYFNGQVPLRAVADVVLKGLGARVIEEKILPRIRQELIEVRAENARLKTGQPSANGSAPHRAAPADDSHLTPEQRAQETFRRFVSGTATNNGFGG